MLSTGIDGYQLHDIAYNSIGNYISIVTNNNYQSFLSRILYWITAGEIT